MEQVNPLKESIRSDNRRAVKLLMSRFDKIGMCTSWAFGAHTLFGAAQEAGSSEMRDAAIWLMAAASQRLRELVLEKCGDDSMETYSDVFKGEGYSGEELEGMLWWVEFWRDAFEEDMIVPKDPGWLVKFQLQMEGLTADDR